MKRRALVSMLVACGSSTPPPAPLENKATAPRDEPPLRIFGCEVRGQVVDAATNEPLSGATVVTLGGDKKEAVVITGDDGKFTLVAENTHSVFTVYYEDDALNDDFNLSFCGKRMRIPFGVATGNHGPISIY